MNNNWILSSLDIFERYRPFLANGYIGVVMDGAGPAWSRPMNHLMQGVWSGECGDELFEKIPDWDRMTFNNGLEDFTPNTGEVSNYKQELDMYNGIITTEWDWTSSSRKTHLNSVMFVSRNAPNLAVIKYSATPVNYSGCVSFKAEINSEAYPGLLQAENDCSGRMFRMSVSTKHTSIMVSIGRINSFAGMKPIVTYIQTKRSIRQEAAFSCTCGETYTAYSYIGIFNSRDNSECAQSAKSSVESAETAGYDVLYKNHTEAWHGIWKTDIQIQGTAADICFHQKLVRSNLFYLLQNVRPGGECSLGPKGFSDNGWNGHVFWDTEVWMLPSILITHPDFAKSLLQYRYNTLDGAKANAALNGCKGADFAWESGYSGRENSIVPYKYEKFISANISQACWQYYLVTKDAAWLAETGYPIIREIAEFIESKVTFKEDKYHVHGVGTPDEYAIEASETGTVDDDAFTNAAFQLALNIGVKAANIVGQKPGDCWDMIATKMYIPYDLENKRYFEYEGYCGKPTKQAAAELLIFPIELPTDVETKVNTMNYYSSLIDEKDGPCLNFGAYTVIYSDMNDRDKAFESYTKSYKNYVRGPFNLYNETASNDNWSFNTGHGGSLIAVINGFAGLRIHEDGIIFKPCLPNGWTLLKLQNIPIGNAVYDISISEDNIASVTLKSGIENVAVRNIMGFFR